jgi:hypothetical protein
VRLRVRPATEGTQQHHRREDFLYELKSWQAHHPFPQVTALSAGAGSARCQPGPRWGRTPIPAGTPTGPRAPPTRASASTTTTHRGRAPSMGRPPRGRCGHLAPQPAPAPTAPPPATGAPHAGLACLVAQPVTRGRRRPPPTRPGRHQRATAAASPARPAGRRPSRSTARQPPRPRPVPAVTVAPGGTSLVQRPGPVWEKTDASGPTAGHRTAGHQPGGHRTAGHQTGGHRGAGRWTGGQRTAGPPDPWTTTPDGWTPHAGHRPATDAATGVLAVSTTATMPDRWMPAGGSARAGTVWASDNQDRSAARTPTAPRCYGRAWPPPRRSAAGATPPSSWRLGALLSFEMVEWRVERDEGRHPLWRALRSVA